MARRDRAHALTLLALGALALARPAAAQLTLQTGHALPVTAVALSADGKLAATASRDGWAILWETARGYKLCGVRADPLGLTAVSLSADGRRLLTGGAGTAILWDSASGKQLRRFGDPGEFLLAAWLSPDARTVTTIAQTGATLWNAATGRRRVAFPAETKVTAAALSPDGKELALAEGSQLEVWSTTDGARGAIVDAGGAIAALAFLPDGALAAATDESVTIWDPLRGLARASLKTAAPVKALLGLPDGRLVGAGGNTAQLWTPTIREDWPAITLIGHSDAVGALFASRNGRRLITGSDDHTARVWSLVRPANAPVVLGGAELPVKFAGVSSDGRRLATVDDQAARLWDLDSGRLIRTSTADWSYASGFSITADGRLLACVRDRGMVELRDLVTGQDLATSHWTALRASSVALDPRGRFLVAGYDRRLQILTIPEARPGPAIDPAPAPVTTLLIGLDGRRLVAFEATGEARFWSLDENRWLGRAQLQEVSTAPNASLSLDGRALVIVTEPASGDEIRLFDLETGLPLDETSPAWQSVAGRRLRERALAQPPPSDWPWAADPKERFVLSRSEDGAALFVSSRDGSELARLTLSDKGWYLRSADGRFDGSPGLLRLTLGLSSLPARGAAPGLLSEISARQR